MGMIVGSGDSHHDGVSPLVERAEPPRSLTKRHRTIDLAFQEYDGRGLHEDVGRVRMYPERLIGQL
jgi:hypothetical protein